MRVFELGVTVPVKLFGAREAGGRRRGVVFAFALLLLFGLGTADAHDVTATQPAPLRIAILSFGTTKIADRVDHALLQSIAASPNLSLIDRDLARAAAAGTGYAGSLNLTTTDAIDLGSAIGCDFYILGDAQTIRRSPSDKPAYFEAYATVFLVSARTGRLILWDRRKQTAPAGDAAENLLIAELDQNAVRYLNAIRETALAERNARAASIGHDLPVIEETPDEKSPAADGFRPPAPYRRVSPQYTAAANAAEVVATVDLQVDLDVEGEVQEVQIARWAGFDLDQAAETAIRQMHFRPATRNGVPFPIRVLLRYNFRKPK